MQNERMIVKEVLQQESFAKPGQVPTLKQGVVFLYPNKTEKQLYISFYGDKVRDAMVLKPGDEVEVGFVISSSCSPKGFWGTYVTGIFLKVLCNADMASEEMIRGDREQKENEASVAQSLQDIGCNIPSMDNDDLPF